jgi:hypothetical protein
MNGPDPPLETFPNDPFIPKSFMIALDQSIMAKKILIGD